jgi:hypothetical protein
MIFGQKTLSQGVAALINNKIKSGLNSGSHAYLKQKKIDYDQAGAPEVHLHHGNKNES